MRGSGAGRARGGGCGQAGADVCGEVAGHPVGGCGDAVGCGPVGGSHGGVHRVGSGGSGASIGARVQRGERDDGRGASGVRGGPVVIAQVEQRCGAHCQGQRLRIGEWHGDVLRGVLTVAVQDLQGGTGSPEAQARRGGRDGDGGCGQLDTGGVRFVAQQARARIIDGAARRALDVDCPHALRRRLLVLLGTPPQRSGHDDDEQHCCDQQEGDARVHSPTLESRRRWPPDHSTRVSTSLRVTARSGGSPQSGEPCARVALRSAQSAVCDRFS